MYFLGLNVFSQNTNSMKLKLLFTQVSRSVTSGTCIRKNFPLFKKRSQLTQNHHSNFLSSHLKPSFPIFGAFSLKLINATICGPSKMVSITLLHHWKVIMTFYQHWDIAVRIFRMFRIKFHRIWYVYNFKADWYENLRKFLVLFTLLELWANCRLIRNTNVPNFLIQFHILPKSYEKHLGMLISKDGNFRFETQTVRAKSNGY